MYKCGVQISSGWRSSGKHNLPAAACTHCTYVALFAHPKPIIIPTDDDQDAVLLFIDEDMTTA
jgi:hypothetical protein